MTEPHTESSPSWLLFDYGGVIAEEGFHDALAALSLQSGYSQEKLPTLAMDAVYESGYVTGHGSESDFWELLRSRFPLKWSNAYLTEEVLRHFTLRPRMLQLVDCLRATGYLAAILSDQTDWLDRLNRRDGFFRHFDRIFNSYHLGTGKRNTMTFDLVLRELSIPAQEAIFIDDNPDNVERALSRGMHVIHFTDIAPLLDELSVLLGEGLNWKMCEKFRV